MQRYVFFFVIPNFKPTFFVKKCNFFVFQVELVGVEPTSTQPPHKRLYKLLLFCPLLSVGGLTRGLSQHGHHLILRKRGKRNYQDVLFLRAWSLGSRLGCDSHCISRRIDVLAVYIFFAISSVCPLLVSYQMHSCQILYSPICVKINIIMYQKIQRTLL